MDFFTTENIVKRYTNHLALNDVSIQIPENTVFGLLGPNGAGKTTLIRIINQITAPDSGRVLFKGEALKPEHVHNIGYLPEERGLYKKMKVGEQAVYLARLKGLSKRDAIKQLRFWFQKFEIEAWWDKKVESLSKGMQQKVQFIVTVLHEPEFLIFDEPFSGFDPINANLLKREILELKRKGATIIFSTHNMASVEEICDNIALINKSQKILGGNIQDVRNRFRNNTFEIHFNGQYNKAKASLSANYKILGTEDTSFGQKVSVQNLQGYTANQLIADMLQCGEIREFQELIPSMNDIFIEVVNQSNQTENVE